MVMEFVEGGIFSRWSRRTVRWTARWPLSISPGSRRTGPCHERNIVHCDISPPISSSIPRVVKILDMGMARLVSTEWRMTPGGQVLGTVDYMARNWRCRARRRPPGDIYSLGCTLYFLLTGHPPFRKEAHAADCQASDEQPQPILEQRPDVPHELVEMCQRMMARSRRMVQSRRGPGRWPSDHSPRTARQSGGPLAPRG